MTALARSAKVVTLRSVAEHIDIVLPMPPSTNNLFFNNARGGRTKTRAYREWIIESGWRLQQQRPSRIIGKYEIEIRVARCHRDLGNCEKSISDLLVRHAIIDDDKWCERIVLSWQSEDAGVNVIVRKWTEARA